MNNKNTVTVTFTAGGIGAFTSPLGCGGGGERLDNLLQEARRAGAAVLEKEWWMEGFGPSKWIYRLEAEVLRDLMLEAGYTPSVG